ncbi:L,D-transpeptidase family protein [Streptomyces sp. NPDC090445]|uniref:L,D-transpeptidase family protein n=1 Tax=Streptomyces sp. NPDC090445 TaxID=3365963 RepID=UPI0037F31A9D
MSKLARVGFPRPRAAVRAGAGVGAVAAVGLLACTAAWFHAVQDAPGNAEARAHSTTDDRPAAVAAAADGRVARESRGSGLQGLPGISERTRAQIPAESLQVVLVTGRAKNSSYATVALYTRPTAADGWALAGSWPARNGARGWSTERRYGDLTSPVGVFSLSDAGGLLPKPPGTRMPYDRSRAFTASGHGVEGESLEGSFDYVVAIDFNRKRGVSPLDPTKPEGIRKGGNIWLHVDHDGPSQGCVGIAKEAMEKVLETLDPAAKPVIVMGPHGF